MPPTKGEVKCETCDAWYKLKSCLTSYGKLDLDGEGRIGEVYDRCPRGHPLVYGHVGDIGVISHNNFR